MKRYSVASLVCLYLLLTAQSIPAQTDWQWQYPLPQGNTLYDVDNIGGTAVAVGDACTVIKTTNGGSSWAVTMNAAGLSVTLRAVCMIDALTAVAVGEGGTIIRTNDGGLTWAARASGTSVSLNDVTFTGTGTGYAVGGAGTVLITTDGGAGWNPISSGSEADLFGISFAHPDTGTVVGSEGTILRTTDGGSSWVAQTSGTTVTLNAVQCLTTSICYAVGGNLVLRTTDGGDTWNTLDTPYWWSTTLEDLSLLYEDWGFGEWSEEGFIVGNIYDDKAEPAIFIYTYTLSFGSGPSWSYTEPPNHMFGICMIGDLVGLAVGKRGVIRRSSDGTTWSAIGGPTPEYLSPFMMGLDFWGIYNGVALASSKLLTPGIDKSFVLRTADGGTTWSRTQVESSGLSLRLHDIAYADENTVYAVGEGDHVYAIGAVMYRSLNGGADWEEIWRQVCPPPNACWGSLHSIDFDDTGHGVTIGSGLIITITSGGATQAASGTDVRLSIVAAGTGASSSAVCMADSTTAFIVGGGGTILRSTDGGHTWDPQVSGVSVNLNGVHFVDASRGTVVGNSGTILRTHNGGDYWFPQNSGTTDDLLRVSFSSAQVGYVIGRSGTILGTTDGGTIWTAEPSPIADMVDVHTFNQHNVTIVGGSWSVIAKRNETVPVFSAALAARPDRTSVQLDWSIGSDGPIRGFHMYRRGGSAVEYARLNQQLIPKESRTFADRTVRPGTRYEYVLAVVFEDGSEVRSNVAAAELPARGIELSQNYPNPFNPVTTIRFSLPETGRVTLTVYDVSGRLVAILVDRIMSFGDHAVEWDTRDRSGRTVSSGVYYYQLEANKRKFTRKMVLIR